MEAELNLNAKEVMDRLVKIQQGMEYIMEYIEDTTLTEEDIKSIDEAREDLRTGKTKRL